MASIPFTQSRTQGATDVWPPDDTEESILGISLHQATIVHVRVGIVGASRLYKTDEKPVPWTVETQLIFLGCRRPDGSLYRTYPDLFIFAKPMDLYRGSFSLAEDGPPVLVVEVLSESTYEADLDLARGKGYSYARAGIQEYLTIDPTYTMLPEGIRAWRLRDGVYQPWLPDADNRWQSEQLPIAIALEGIWATVYTRDGRRMHREGEFEEELMHRESELAGQERRLLQEHELRERAEAEVARLKQLLAERGVDDLD
ncbi:MAG TPA: Uma2 family endonuclease [Chloroflexota bacterium]|jgi:hypothetical protein